MQRLSCLFTLVRLGSALRGTIPTGCALILAGLDGNRWQSLVRGGSIAGAVFSSVGGPNSGGGGCICRIVISRDQ